jgi:hypothetical protein
MSKDITEPSKRMNWLEQRRLMLLEVEGIINELTPCATDRLIAEIEYRTGLSLKKAQEALGIFFNRGTITTKDKEGKKICVVK